MVIVEPVGKVGIESDGLMPSAAETPKYIYSANSILIGRWCHGDVLCSSAASAA